MRFIVLALIVAFATLRVAPDAVRVFLPLSYFGYATDAAGTVDWVAPHPKPSPAVLRRRPRAAQGRATKKRVKAAKPQKPPVEYLRVGDRIVIDRVPAFDRKPGLLDLGYSRDNPDRRLTIIRRGSTRVVTLGSHPEPVASRVATLMRVLLFLTSLALASILFLLRPSIATGAIFFYCVGAPAPTTFSEVVLDNPWQQIPIWLADVLHGAGRPALLVFAVCLLTSDPRTTRVTAAVAAIVAFVLGNLLAFADWSATYAGRPEPLLANSYIHASSAITILAVAAFAIAFWRAHAAERVRIGGIAAAFALAGVARVISDLYFPGTLVPWQNEVLLSATIFPIAFVWFSVLRHDFFNIDFVVGRAIVYVALTAAVVGTITLAEEVGTYVFYQNTDLAYGFLIVISTGVGMATGKIREFIESLVDRFVFRDRHERREALELISGYVLDAENTDDVYRALLEDTTHALGIDFAGVLVRDARDAFTLGRACNWPADFDSRFAVSDDVVREISRTRATLEFAGKKRRRDIAAAFDLRLSLAAPLLADRQVVALVAYGRNVSGLNLNSDERERLTRLVAHASLALASIELEQRRAGSSVPDALVAIEPDAPERVRDRGER